MMMPLRKEAESLFEILLEITENLELNVYGSNIEDQKYSPYIFNSITLVLEKLVNK